MSSSARGIVRTLALGLLLPIVGCPMLANVAIRPGRTVETLEFGVASEFWHRPVAVPMFMLASCRSASDTTRLVYWQIEATSEAGAVQRIRYGIAPPGYSTIVQKKQLSPHACFEVSYGGAEEFYFSVDSRGKIVEISPRK